MALKARAAPEAVANHGSSVLCHRFAAQVFETRGELGPGQRLDAAGHGRWRSPYDKEEMMWAVSMRIRLSWLLTAPGRTRTWLTGRLGISGMQSFIVGLYRAVLASSTADEN